MFNSVQDFQAFGKDQFEAATQSAAALGQGVQKLVAGATELSKKSFETSTEAFQGLLASRSVDGAMQAQMTIARAAYDSMVSGSTLITGIMSTTAQDVFKPFEGALQKMQSAVRGNLAA